ncbi:NAD(P)-dependent oxidoreductase [Dactylosporangium sp. AC04546]|uniref:NAD(P)-dependent oxidoreductase n=1 Tax=Dactylosporangium sp. AC04546 TaxID=2862460 RepID=UPI001EE0D641|nr:NAD(P)-dependent oxidoreductase [Dactylosporangium sp. AC04546]WVK86520.1 NAD(P)-dependent oxidoreductase [Dactylosporangium sp. AC04546]
MRIGWIGTGLMGAPMAGRLIEAGHQVGVHNRTRAKAEPLLALGAEWAGSVAEAARDRDVVVTMLSYPQDVAAAYEAPDGILAVAAPGTIAIDMSTSSPGLARRLAELAAGGPLAAVLDAPVSGGPAGARGGTLSIFVGGDADAVARIRPLLEALGTTVVHHGPAGSGQAAKLVNQALVANVTQGVCEAFAAAEAAGLEPDRVLESLRVGVAGSPLLDFAWTRLAAGDLEPGFKVAHLAKDLRLALDEVGDARELPGTAQVYALCQAVVDALGGDRGTQALITTTRNSRGTQ